jgi:5-methylcytosine-specific restriction endonuclease McrA
VKLTDSGRAKQQYALQGGHCAWCGKTFPLADMTRDHAIPRSLGGSPDWNNIVLACAPCNERRGDSLPDQPLQFAVDIGAGVR